MRMHTVVFFFCMLSALAVERSARAKSFIFNKVSGGSSLDGKKSGDLVKNAPSASYKRSADDLLGLHPLYRRSQRKRSPYGLVYNQGKPIGILEPISQSFEYSAYANPREGGGYHGGAFKSQWFPVKREADYLDEERDESEASAPLHSNNYASVLAKFKVNNKVKQRPYQDFLYSQQVKREASREQPLDDLRKRGAFDIGDLTAAPQAAEGKGGAATNKVAKIEENLKDVMGDMGLVEKKREIYFEDEDLENGLNKIGLTKESHYDRNKKENCPGKTKVKFKAAAGKRAHKKLKKKPEEEPEEEDEEDTKRSVGQQKQHVERKSVVGGDVKAHVANYQSEGEAFIRSKRQQQEKDSEDTTDIMKGLEQSSGDLTVSGNKSPLVAVTSADDLKNQEKRDKEELEYEKRLERNIQAKINAIKDEVKREIGKMKSDDAQRKKREIASTLLDEETSALDPGLNIDQKLEPYVRKRRDLLEQAEAEAEETKKKNSAKKKESRDAINEVKSPAKKRGAQAEPNALARNVTKRSSEEESAKKNKRSETEVDLSTGRTVIDLGEPHEKNAAVDEQENKEGERQERNAKCHKDKDKKRSNVTEEGDDIAKRNSDDAMGDDYLVAQRSADTQKVESDYDAPAQKEKIYDYGRLERNSKGGGGVDDDSNVYRQGRKRRDVIRKKQKRYVRRKRNDFSDEDADLLGYRADGDGEIDDEGDEMDDDGFNDQTSNFLLDKRQAADYADEENDGDYEDEIADDYAERNKRNVVVDDGGDFQSDFPFYPTRRKRQDFEQLVAAHGGDAALNHLGAARDRNMRPIEKNYRRKRLERLNKLHSQKQGIAELSESDLFGGLPQSYEGELSRFKRVKRQTLD